MSDENQIEVPPSFTALYTAPGGHRLTEPMRHVRERYELSEDMAQMLSEHAAAAHAKSGGDTAAVLRQVAHALGEGESATVRPDEARWIATRIAELLGWEAPAW